MTEPDTHVRVARLARQLCRFRSLCPCVPRAEAIVAAYDDVAVFDSWDKWLTTPALGFGGQSALALLKAGRDDEVLAALDQIASGAFV